MALLARQRVFPAPAFDLRVFGFRPRKQTSSSGFFGGYSGSLPETDALRSPRVSAEAKRGGETGWQAEGGPASEDFLAVRRIAA
eukprot:scaffold19935_cov48-Phaeocystis_antarctica.AAC.3